jgi:hypothetical protein
MKIILQALFLISPVLCDSDPLQPLAGQLQTLVDGADSLVKVGSAGMNNLRNTRIR